MSSYTQSLQHHLGNYKQSRLGVTEHGTFAHRGRELRYAKSGVRVDFLFGTSLLR